MRIVKWVLGALALSAVMVAPAWADRGHIRFGVNIGVPFWPWYYGPAYYPPAYAYPPAYYYPPVVAEPPVYIEQPPATYVPPPAPQAQAPAPQTGNWYYCESAQGYYPYVKECPSGWRMVPAQPPAAH
jgi:hypothetical protein